MAYRNLYSTECLDVQADPERKSVQLEAASSGYRPRYVTVEIESLGELDRLIAALSEAREYLK
ncbi:hypothetical protein GE107_12295 [Cohnella sp. CFH 77786]|uniref:hypothetical protein n=1 Tax=Cohnella sp. CFH 77786 TaxID=2662265 RepID=UPI001C60A6B9|nr:hypothetical protein [Cohnella sp. CFH 77786]MBW5446844.1 hypothetical protein [Cohnella sp. CFH 77786]